MGCFSNIVPKGYIYPKKGAFLHKLKRGDLKMSKIRIELDKREMINNMQFEKAGIKTEFQLLPYEVGKNLNIIF